MNIRIELKDHKRHLRSFMQSHYTDQRLAEVLAYAQDGKLRYLHCCCFIGAATSEVLGEGCSIIAHYTRARYLPGADAAESAYRDLARNMRCESFSELDNFDKRADDMRRRIIIPMLRAEIRRRDRLCQVSRQKENVVAEMALA